MALEVDAVEQSRDLILKRYKAGYRSLKYWLKLNDTYGSVIKSCSGDLEIVANLHYPENDWKDLKNNSQCYYHCHRPEFEHGHIHIFKKINNQSELTHLLAISLDPRGLPINLFTVNQWVVKDNWLPADQIIDLIKKFSFYESNADINFNKWIDNFMCFYFEKIKNIILERDVNIIKANLSLDQSLNNKSIEIASQIKIDWANDLDLIQKEWKSRVKSIRKERIEATKSKEYKLINLTKK